MRAIGAVLVIECTLWWISFLVGIGAPLGGWALNQAILILVLALAYLATLLAPPPPPPPPGAA